MYKKLLSYLIISFLITFSGFVSAYANTATEFTYSPENEGAIRLVVSNMGVEEGSSKKYAGLHIKFKDEWKTYWKHAGDTGMPVQVKDERSKNIKNLKILWPAPERFDYYGIETWGYKHEVVIPVEYEVEDASQPTYLGLDVKWAICDEICIFEDDVLSLLIKPDVKDEDNFNLINQYLKQVPKDILAQNEVSINGFSINDEKISFVFESNSEPFKEGLDLFIFEESENFKFPAPEIKFSDDRKRVEIITTYEKLLKGVSLYDKVVELTLANKERSYQTDFDVKNLAKTIDSHHTDQNTDSNAKGDGLSRNDAELVNSAEGAIDPKDFLLLTLFFAFLGGLILNIMPCVLPVLSIKIMSIIKHGDSDKSYIRKSFLATILGILFSFLLLASLVAVLKSFGDTVSWGMQFQQPEFLIFLSFVVTLFACNQFGFFEISLPGFLGGKINSKIDSAGGNASVSGNFLTGAFATLMATPCTAPFLSTAIAFSLGVGAKYIFLVFLFMGLGLAFPYILILFFPSLVKIFPKPGAWMIKFRVVLGLLLMLTVAWLVYVMMSNIGVYSAMLLVACLLSLMVFLFFAKKWGLKGKKVLFTVIYICVIALVIPRYFARVEIEAKSMGDIWIAYDENIIEENVNKGRVVFVDVTADWCLTCKFNKARVINPLRDFYEENDVVLVKADFTRPSRLIQDYLAANDAYAIPLNIIYGPSKKDGIKLPALLTEEAVKEAIISAK